MPFLMWISSLLKKSAWILVGFFASLKKFAWILVGFFGVVSLGRCNQLWRYV